MFSSLLTFGGTGAILREYLDEPAVRMAFRTGHLALVPRENPCALTPTPKGARTGGLPSPGRIPYLFTQPTYYL